MSSITAGTTSTTTLIHSGDTTGSLVFKTNDTGSGGTTAVTIDTSQRVGIGTTSPSNILDIVSASNPTIRITDTTNNCYTELNATDTVGYVGTASNHAFAFTTNNTERMRIDSSGRVFIGTTSFTGLLNMTQTAGDWAIVENSTYAGTQYFNSFRYNSTQIGTITGNNTATAYNTSSDYRLKENIAPMTGALAKVAQLKPVTYKWKVDGSDGEGFIAHELAEVKPDCVSGEKDAVDAEGKPIYQGIDTSFLVATLTAAIQELKAINDTQAETINALTARVVALEGQ